MQTEVLLARQKEMSYLLKRIKKAFVGAFPDIAI